MLFFQYHPCPKLHLGYLQSSLHICDYQHSSWIQLSVFLDPSHHHNWRSCQLIKNRNHHCWHCDQISILITSFPTQQHIYPDWSLFLLVYRCSHRPAHHILLSDARSQWKNSPSFWVHLPIQLHKPSHWRSSNPNWIFKWRSLGYWPGFSTRPHIQKFPLCFLWR